MATLLVEDGLVVIALSALERVGALRRGDVSVPLDSVTDVVRHSEARKAIRGVRAPGTVVPGVLALGTWRTKNGPDFVAVARSEPGYEIALSGQHFTRLIVSSPPISELEALTDS